MQLSLCPTSYYRVETASLQIVEMQMFQNLSKHRPHLWVRGVPLTTLKCDPYFNLKGAPGSSSRVSGAGPSSLVTTMTPVSVMSTAARGVLTVGLLLVGGCHLLSWP